MIKYNNLFDDKRVVCDTLSTLVDAYFSKCEDMLANFSFAFDSSLILPSLQKFKLEWMSEFSGHSGFPCQTSREICLL